MTLHCLRAGHGAPPLVFVHGFACAHDDWQAQIEHFSARHQVLACDLPGHGRSPGTAADCSMERFGAEVAALLEDLDAPAIVVGHSMGCRVVLQAARLAPDRVAALALVDGSRMALGEPQQAEAAMRQAIEFAGYEVFAEALFRQMFFSPSAAAERIIERAKRLPPAIGTALFPAMARWDASQAEAALRAVRMPLLALQSTKMSAERKRSPMRVGDANPWLDLVQRCVPHARLEVIEGVGHFPQIEAAGRVNSLLASLP
jgi:pimeloyl-ACP methyl ester carboxylesterase